MIDLDAGKLLIVGVIALVFIPPKDLPRVLRQVGQFVGKMRRMAGEFQGQFMEAMREADMADLRNEAHKLADSVRFDVGMDSIDDLHSSPKRQGKQISAPSQSDNSEHEESATDGAAAYPIPATSEGSSAHRDVQPDNSAPSTAHSG